MLKRILAAAVIIMAVVLPFIALQFVSQNVKPILQNAKAPIDSQSGDAKQLAKIILSNCGEGIWGEQCYATQFSSLLRNHDLNFGMQVLSALEDLDPSARGCHLIAHSMTLAETKKNPNAWQDLLSAVDADSCSGGFIHGVLEARSTLDKTFVVNEQTIPQICDIVAQKHSQGGEFNCAHIVGHILMANHGGNIPESIAVCSKIADNLQYECFSGVFMENETRDNLASHQIAAHIPWNEQTTQDQETICQHYDGTAGLACWREISHMYAFTSIDDPASVFASCNRANNQQFADDCYSHAIGIMSGSNRFDIKKTALLCKPYEKDGIKFSKCIDQIVGSLMASSAKFADRAIILCQTTLEGFREGCFQQLGVKLGTLVSAEERRQLCAPSPQQYIQLCAGS